MKRVILFVIVFSISHFIYAQKFETFIGGNYNQFYNITSIHGETNYTPKLGYSAGFGLDSVQVDWLRLRLFLQLDKYSGDFYINEYSHTSSSIYKGNANKYTIMVSAFPIYFNVFKKIDISFGLTFSQLLFSNLSGTAFYCDVFDGVSTNKLDINKYLVKSIWGIQGKIGYKIKIKESLWISPQYSMYYSLTNEFKEVPANIKSKKQYFCISIIQRI